MIKYQFQFETDVPFDEIDNTLMLSTLAVECIHGRTQVHMDAKFQATRKDNICWIKADNEVGRHLALIFTGFMARLFGERSFKIECFDSNLANDFSSLSTQGVAA